MYGNLRLFDDGTLDTVVIHVPSKTAHRFSQEHVSDFPNFQEFMGYAERWIEEELQQGNI